MNLQDLEHIVPFSRASTEVFKTGLWSPYKPLYLEKTSPCRQACPVGIDMARAFIQASKGDLDRALSIVREDNPLPGICGRVCYHPCELNCNRGNLDEPVNIRGFERYLSDHGRVDLKEEAPKKDRKERIAVIGSGPAGLSAAFQLVRMGYKVTIFESLPEPGGMLRYGIPEYRLPKKILSKEISFIRRLGVEIKTGIWVGRDYTLSEIKKSFQALFIAVGSQKGQRLGMEGEDFPGIWEGIEFLRRINYGEKIKIGRRVVVIGGGNTAIDCARTAKRIGGKQVTLVYRRSWAEMPALADDRTLAAAEGSRFELLTAPNRLLLEKGRVVGLECIRMELGAPDRHGRPLPVPIPGSEFSLPADTVIGAVGQRPETEFIQELGLEVDAGGMISVDSESPLTSVPGVFAGGDCAGNRAFVAHALGSGKSAALAISCYLQGKNFRQEFLRHQIGLGPSFSFQAFKAPEKKILDLKKVASIDKMNVCAFPYGIRRNNPSSVSSKEERNPFEEESKGLTRADLEMEVSRCFKCGTCTQCDLCFLICPDLAILKIAEEGYSIKGDHCKGCGMCASTCPRQVIDMGEAR